MANVKLIISQTTTSVNSSQLHTVIVQLKTAQSSAGNTCTVCALDGHCWDGMI